MIKIQRLSKDNLELLQDRLEEIRGDLQATDLTKPRKIVTKPIIYDLSTPIAGSKKQKRQ